MHVLVVGVVVFVATCSWGLCQAQDHLGVTPLMRAASRGHDAALHMLLENHADPAKQDNFGNTALHHACEGGHPACAVTLVENDASVHVKNRRGKTPMALAPERVVAAVVALRRK